MRVWVVVEGDRDMNPGVRGVFRNERAARLTAAAIEEENAERRKRGLVEQGGNVFVKECDL